MNIYFFVSTQYFFNSLSLLSLFLSLSFSQFDFPLSPSFEQNPVIWLAWDFLEWNELACFAPVLKNFTPGTSWSRGPQPPPRPCCPWTTTGTVYNCCLLTIKISFIITLCHYVGSDLPTWDSVADPMAAWPCHLGSLRKLDYWSLQNIGASSLGPLGS